MAASVISAEQIHQVNSRRWSYAQYLALLAVPILIWNLWTFVAWLAGGPHGITQFETQNSVSWYAALAFEAVGLLGSAAIAIYVIRGCIRESRITMDALFCLAGFTLTWQDATTNVLQPAVLMSSNFANLNAMCGHLPFVVNPDCGTAADSYLFIWPLDTFGFLAGALAASVLVRRVRARRPEISNGRLFILLFIVAVPVSFAFEALATSLGLWTYAPGPLQLSFGHGSYFWPDMFAFGTIFAVIASLRVLTDDRGKTLVERGTESLRPLWRTPVAFLAIYCVFQVVVGVTTVPIIVNEFYAQPFNYISKSLLNNACNADGIHDTAYGPCPGSPGYRMPGRDSLPAGTR